MPVIKNFPITSSVLTRSVQNKGMLAGLMVSTGLLVPLKIFSTYKAYDWQNFKGPEKRLLLTQEVARQASSTALWMSSLAASWGISGQLVGTNQPWARFLSANLIASFVDSIGRPFITAVITKHLMHWQTQAPQALSSQKPVGKFSTPPNWGGLPLQQPQQPRIQYVF